MTTQPQVQGRRQHRLHIASLLGMPAIFISFSGCGDTEASAKTADAAQSAAPTAVDQQYRLALATPGVTASHRLLVAATKAGSLAAATRMIQLAMWDEMGDIDPHQPPFSTWAATSAPARATGSARPSMAGHGPGVPTILAPAIVAAEFRANWATRHREAADWRALKSGARTVLANQAWDCGEPIVIGELAWLYQDAVPPDPENAITCTQRLATRFTPDVFIAWDDRRHALAIAEQLTTLLDRQGDRPAMITWWTQAAAASRGRPGVQAECLDQLARCQLGTPITATDWTAVMALHAQAAELARQAGDPWVQGDSLMLEAQGLQPDNNPAGDWSRAAAMNHEAAGLLGQAGDLDRESVCLAWEAWCWHGDHEKGDWTRSATLYGQAAQLAGEAGFRKDQGYDLAWQAFCLRPDNNPAGAWAQAAERYAQAADITGQAGDRGEEAENLAWQAYCLYPPNNHAGNWAQAASIYARAAAIQGQTGDHQGQAKNLEWEANCLRPDLNRDGDWSRAAALYAQVAGLLDNPHESSHCLFMQAWCVQPDHNPAGDWHQAADLYARSAALSAAASDPEGQGSALLWQAWCVQPDHNPAGDWAQAVALLDQSAALFRRTGDHRCESSSLCGEATCLNAPGNPARDAAKARRLYAQAAALVAPDQAQPGGGAGQNPAFLY